MNSKDNLEKKNSKQNICSYFIEHKKRFCKMLTSKEQRYCGQHLIYEMENNFSNNHFKRIPCPLDQKHSCFIRKLDQHLKKCNAKRKYNLPYLSKGINTGDRNLEEKEIDFRKLSDEELIAFIYKLDKSYDDFVGPIDKEFKTHKVLEKYTASFNTETSRSRHLKQNASILGHLKDIISGSLYNDLPRIFIEFGAGRGQLTNLLVEAVNDDKTTFILIDKGAQRYKCDAKLKHRKDVNFKRFQIDIEDLDLTKIEEFTSNSSVIGCAKHLCGAATDFALRCLTQSITAKISGIFFAICCHHRITWRAYTGKNFLNDLGFDAKDFSILLSLSSWAVSNPKHNKDNINHDNCDHSPNNSSFINGSLDKQTRYQKLGLSNSRRGEIGRKVKHILDMGRVHYLNEHNYESKLIEYVTQSETLENVALVAVPKIKLD